MAEQLTTTNLASQMKEDYLSYSMAVLLGRAIPDLYDGLKPVQRRVLQTMLEEGLSPEKRYVKCARVTGLTMAYYHPHGGAYGALVNMATPWNNNVPWIDGHGNFGSSVDGPAAERYTECKLRPSATDLLLLDRETWETIENYDGSRQEAVRFNTTVPSVLLNGDSGIAVGFATKLAPHNLREVIEATKQVSTKKSAELYPDFPTGCDIVKDEGLTDYARTGSGSIRVRAKLEIAETKKQKGKTRTAVTFTNLPPGINPEKVGEQIKDALDKGKIYGVAEVIDESDLSGDRITVITKANTDTELLTKQLYAYTDLDTRYSAKTLVIDGTRPVELSPIDICKKWFDWRLDRLQAKYELDLEKTNARLHIVEGLLKAIGSLDDIIKLIRSASSRPEALIKLVDKPYKFSRDQANAILDMRLSQLTKLDHTALANEKTTLWDVVLELEDLIKDPKKRAAYAVKFMTQLATRHGEARRSALIEPPDSLGVTVNGERKTRVAAAPRPRFVKIDMKRGVVEQVKGPRGAMVLDQKDKLITLTEDGTLKRVAANYKGTLGESFSPVLLAKKETEVVERKYLAVFTLDEQLKAMMVEGSDLCRVTSKGKKALPDGAKMLYFGEGSYTVPWVSTRKKKVELFPVTTKKGRPGAKGIKIANVQEIQL
jgi:DNA gyrase subunit A